MTKIISIEDLPINTWYYVNKVFAEYVTLSYKGKKVNVYMFDELKELGRLNHVSFYFKGVGIPLETRRSKIRSFFQSLTTVVIGVLGLVVSIVAELRSANCVK